MQKPDLHITYRDVPNIGILDIQVPEYIMQVLSSSARKILEENFKNSTGFQTKLVGHLKHEYVMEPHCWEMLEPLVLHAAKLYDERWRFSRQVDIGVFNDNTQLRLKDLWVNFQKKHEFNPPHLHTGIFSFVIWVNIPYDLQEEEKVFPAVDTDSNKTSKFTFHFSNVLGMHSGWPIPVDKTFQGKMLFFPAAMTHSVNPFYTSDEYRISIAGNLGVRL
jgi:hypothetical protein